MVLLFDERIFEMTAQQPEDHIKNPYTLAEIRAKIVSNDYSAEMLLQHAMLLLDGAALSANVGEPLTDEQIEREWQFLHDEEGNHPDHSDFARAIEAAHGIGIKKGDSHD